MSAWEKLLAASQLIQGTAWELLSNPQQGSSGLLVIPSEVLELGRVIPTPIQTSVEPEIPVTEIEYDKNNNQAQMPVTGNTKAVGVSSNEATIRIR